MPRRKKRFMLLKGAYGRLIVVSRHWYDTVRTPGLGGMRYDRRWKIMAQHDDESMLITMAKLSDNYVGMQVNHTHEDEKGNITNVRS
jgi:hypothetical protein